MGFRCFLTGTIPQLKGFISRPMGWLPHRKWGNPMTPTSVPMQCVHNPMPRMGNLASRGGNPASQNVIPMRCKNFPM